MQTKRTEAIIKLIENLEKNNEESNSSKQIKEICSGSINVCIG
jgi:hypothetical protein